jgi:hypothetical protein
MVAIMNIDTQSGLHVSPITALWRSTQPSGTCGVIPLRGPRWLGLYLTHDESDSLRSVSRMKQSCICWLMPAWASCGDRAESPQYLSMEAVSGHTRHASLARAVLSCPAASLGASRPASCISVTPSQRKASQGRLPACMCHRVSLAAQVRSVEYQ